MLATWVLLVSVAIGVFSGLLIGSVGVGGIVLVPCLIQLPDITIQTAIAACMFSYIFAGITGGITFALHNPIRWPLIRWILIGAVPGGFAGAFVLQYAPDEVIKAVLYGVILVTTVFSLYRHSSSSSEDELDDVKTEFEIAQENDVIDVDQHQCNEDEGEGTKVHAARFCLGMGVAFGSAITGSSGPVLLLPVLISLKWDIIIALGCAQLIQIPIAGAATISYVTLRPGVLDVVLGLCVAAGIVPALLIGAAVAHRMPRKTLTLVVLGVLLVASFALIAQLAISYT